MRTLVADPKLIAFCGLYCGACKAYLSEKCPGCRENVKATWCKVRACGLEHNYQSCADCRDFANAVDCGTFNNVMAKLFGLLFRSDRPACIALIKQKGYPAFAEHMTKNQTHSLKRR